MKSHYFGLLTFLFIFSGCTVGPKYIPPEIDIPDTWHSAPTEGVSADNPDRFLWWESLNDPILNSLLQRAAQQNVDLFIAGNRILQARLEHKGKKAERYPHIDASLTTGHLNWGKDLQKNVLGACSSHEHARKRNVNFFEAGFDATWEIDLFGFQKHEENAAEAREESAEAILCDVWITLSAEIARNYIELRGLQQRRNLLFQNIETWQESIGLTQQLLTIGMASAIDVAKLEEQLSLVISQKPLLDLSIDKAIHRLSILLGDPPGELFSELCESQQIPLLPFKKPIGLPSELLRRRPDIRKAERNLAAATESVGSAVAALFPRLSLYGFIGGIGTQLRSLTNCNGVTWFAAPQLLFPIFNSRLLQQDVKFNKIQAQQALFEYQKSVLAALEEVENAIASLHYETERNQELHRAQDKNEEAYQLTLELYQKGIKDYLEVLAARRSSLLIEETYLQSQIDLVLHYISLYKALGGGWDISQCN